MDLCLHLILLPLQLLRQHLQFLIRELLLSELLSQLRVSIPILNQLMLEVF